MIASMLIKEDILPLQINDSMDSALSAMNEYKVSHFPVVNGNKFAGIITEKDILNIDSVDLPITEKMLKLENSFVNEHQYVYDVLKFASESKLSLIPVTDDSGSYVGSISQKDLVGFFAESMSVHMPGAVIILEVSENDYSFTEIANIVESNDSKILSTFIISKPDSTKIEVVLKISKIDPGAILQTFDRYSYKVIASYQESSNYDELKDNYESLMNYLKF